MKYIIEIKPEYEDSFKGVMILGTKDSNLFVDTLAVENLEVLNSDYINEHYGSLQDDAYQKGLEEGKKQAKVQAHLDVCHDIERVAHGNYQKGLDDAWEAARKIIHMPEGELLNIFTECYSAVCTALQVILKYDASEAIEKLKAYEEKQKHDDKIEVGDEVNWLGDCFIVTRIFQPHNMKEQCDGIDDDGCVYHDVLMDDLEKTGRHFDIASILEDMRHD